MEKGHVRREKKRDDRDYDTTQLHESGHGKTLARDYSAHFFRWSFARRFITTDDIVLDIGCGQDRPLSKILTGGASPHVKRYVGVDMNKLKESNSQRLKFIGEFNFVERHKELQQYAPNGYSIIVHLEVIEHMKVEHGKKFLKACYGLLVAGGIMLMSTPCYDGKRHAANHIHEYTIDELQNMIENAGFTVRKRYGTFMDIKNIGREKTGYSGLDGAIANVRNALSPYYDNDALSCIFAPLYPDHSRNNLWVCEK